MVEQTFAVLKSQLFILQVASHYLLMTQVKIVVAVYVLYNFIRKWNRVAVLFKEKKYEHLNYEDGELHEIEEEIHATPYI